MVSFLSFADCAAVLGMFDEIPLRGFGCGGAEPRKATSSELPPRRRFGSWAVVVLTSPFGVGRWTVDAVVFFGHKLRLPKTAFIRPQPVFLVSGELSPIFPFTSLAFSPSV